MVYIVNLSSEFVFIENQHYLFIYQICRAAHRMEMDSGQHTKSNKTKKSKAIAA